MNGPATRSPPEVKVTNGRVLFPLWPLPASGLDAPVAEPKGRCPLIGDLIEIAISEKNPDQVLRWYDQRPEDRFGWYGVDDDAIATAVQAHAPDRSVTLWKEKAERLIAQVKPSAYQEAVKHLRKAGRVMAQEKKPTEWQGYLTSLRSTHALQTPPHRGS